MRGVDDFYTCKHVVNTLINDFPTPGSYFDMSAGDGYVAQQLQERGWSIAGQVDVQPRSVAVQKQDFLDVLPFPVTLVGFNPPFGKEASLAKRFLKHVSLQWQPEFIAIILPRRMRGTTRVKNYSIRVKRNVDEFYRPKTNKMRQVKTTFWILQRQEGTEAILSKKPVIDLRVPDGVSLYPRTKALDARVNVIIRVQGGNAGRDAMIAGTAGWHVMKSGRWLSTPICMSESPWKINKRRSGADFALLVIPWTRLKELVEYVRDHPEPREYVVPSMSRTWLCHCLRTYASTHG